MNETLMAVETASGRPFTVRPLSPAMGAEIVGLDLSQHGERAYIFGGSGPVLSSLLLLDLLFPLPLPTVRDTSVVVAARDGSPLRAFADTQGIWRYPTTPEQVTLTSLAPAIKAIGVTEIRLFVIGTPYVSSISCATLTKFFALVVIFLYILSRAFSPSLSMQSNKEIPMVMVRISKLSSSNIRMVSKILSVLNIQMSP